MDQFENERRAPRSDDALPPVEPPTAGFILQLFIVPAIIVVIIVMVWLMFNWLAHMGDSPQRYVDALKKGSTEARWQAAHSLSDALNRDRGQGPQSIKNNPDMSRQIGEILEAEIAEGSMQERPIRLRFYLCRALGEFNVPDGLPALVKAATTQREADEMIVRRGALQAIAVLADNVSRAKPGTKLTSPELTAALLAAATDPSPQVRASAAFTLGVAADGDALNEALRKLAKDLDPDVRFNAATGLARHGDVAAQDVLVEMLDPAELAAARDTPQNSSPAERTANEETKESPGFKRTLIVVNALRAAKLLAEHNHAADLSPLGAAVEKLLATHPEPVIRVEATDTLKTLKQRK